MSKNYLNMMMQIKFLVLFVLLIGTACQSPKKVEMPPIPVSAMKVIKQKIPANFAFVGVAESSHIIQMRARVEGYLESINYKEGSMVKAGDLLFVIDQRPFIAALEQAQADLERQRAILWNAEQIKARMVALYDQDAISERDLDNALADEMAARANVMAGEAKVYQADLNLSFASITAPADAMASMAKYREGALISPDQTLLTTLYVIDPIWINFSVSDRDLLIARDEIKKGQLVYPKDNQFTVEAVLSDGTIIPSKGFIDFTSPAIQQDTGTMLIRSVFPNSEYLIYPGQFVRVVVKGAYRPDCIIVPQTAVTQGEASPFVYVIDQSSRVERRQVTLGDWFEDYWIILDGLKEGETVVGVGVNKVQEGAVVQVVDLMPQMPTVNPRFGTQGNTLGF
jgi:membrane fusion protein (multidrug efflux system)